MSENTISKPNSVLLIDASKSMRAYDYANATKICSSTFIGESIPGDAFGLITIKSNGEIIDPQSGTDLIVVDPERNAVKKAMKIIKAIAFDGSQTNIKEGIAKGRLLLDKAPFPKAMVLLSDGEYNTGGSPLNDLPDYPIYTCSMGKKGDDATMKKIALRTGGKFFKMVRPINLQTILNQIRSLVEQVPLIRNVVNHYDQSGGALIPVYVSDKNDRAQFVVEWNDASINYTNSSNPKPSEVSITVVNSRGGEMLHPTIIGDGHCIFNATKPVAGEWHIQVMAGASVWEKLVTTSCAFEYPSHIGQSVSLEVETPSKVKLGESIAITAKIQNAQKSDAPYFFTATVEQPIATEQAILEHYASELEELGPFSVDADAPENWSVENRNLAHVYANQFNSQAELSPEHRPIEFSASQKEGNYQAVHTDTAIPGTYAVHVEVRDHSELSESSFQRSYMTTVEVE